MKPSKRRIRRALGRLKRDAYIPPHKNFWYRAFLSLPYQLLSSPSAERHAFLWSERMPDGRTPAQAIDAGDSATVLRYLRGADMPTPLLLPGATCESTPLEIPKLTADVPADEANWSSEA